MGQGDPRLGTQRRWFRMALASRQRPSKLRVLWGSHPDRRHEETQDHRHAFDIGPRTGRERLGEVQRILVVAPDVRRYSTTGLLQAEPVVRAPGWPRAGA